ncbi:MAG: acylphosphatase [Acidobacteria bacterium CG_4_9_14_3_um_filter_49_7]|nr:MAG: acylphosphatase [Acidobacteria bacterium CG_4_9_14_3_um_filter_49_7]
MEDVGVRRVHLIVHGRVQGVGFRFFAATVAARHNIRGFVRNRMDGTVEIDAEGTEERLQSFLAEIRRGPSYGHVDHVEEASLPAKGYRSFDIAR